MINHNFQETNREEINGVCELGIIDLQNKVNIVRMTKQAHMIVSLEDSSGLKYKLPGFCKFEMQTSVKSSESYDKYSFKKRRQPVEELEATKDSWKIMTLADIAEQSSLNQWVTIKDKNGEPYKIQITLIQEQSIFWPESKINFYENKLAIIQ